MTMCGLHIHYRSGGIRFASISLICFSVIVLWVCWGCGGEKKATAPAHVAEVTAVTLTPKDTPVFMEWVGQTESSHRVEIRARIEGYLEKRLYEEGELVKEGQVMFQIDRKPFEAALQQARGVLAQQEARWTTAKANLARVKPLAAQNAVSQKDLDDATGQEQAAAAAVLSAQGQLREAELNLGYTTITAPVTGVSSKANQQDGAYISTGQSSLLTYVAKLDPIWVNYSMSENEWLKLVAESKQGILRTPPDSKFVVEVILADGSSYPQRGHLTFADPSFSAETGTFLVRAVMKNPVGPGMLKPGQFVRVRVHGAVRPNAITVPRRAVMEGAKGQFVWIVDAQNTAEVRQIIAGDWHGDDIFVTKGLKAGERVIVDGVMTLAENLPVKIVEKSPAAAATDAPQATQKKTQVPRAKAEKK